MNGNKRWKRIGVCNRCGECCVVGTPPARIKAYEEANIEYVVNWKQCIHLNLETNLCMNYDDRPEHCKQFPIRPVDIVPLPMCSYSFIRVKQ